MPALYEDKPDRLWKIYIYGKTQNVYDNNTFQIRGEYMHLTFL
jgi:hypothetical protein